MEICETTLLFLFDDYLHAFKTKRGEIFSHGALAPGGTFRTPSIFGNIAMRNLK